MTDRDIALFLGEHDKAPSKVRIGEVAKSEIVAVGPDTDAEEVSRRMQEAQVRRILVTEGDRLVGIISTADLARASSKSSRDEMGEKVERVMEKVSEPSGRPRA